jgi:YidC/Oxa1 family membrane protein insertase
MVLIFALVAAWMYLTAPSPEDIARQQKARALQDSLRALAPTETASIVPSGERQPESYATLPSAAADTVLTTVEGPDFTAVFSNVGAGPVSIRFHKYTTWSGAPVQLVSDTTRSAYSLGFISPDNKNVELRNVVFKAEQPGGTITLGEQPISLSYVLPVGEDASVRYTYTLTPGTYQFKLKIDFVQASKIVAGRRVEFGWKPSLAYSEKSHVQEGKNAAAVAYAGGEIEKLQLLEAGRKEQTITGLVQWSATKTQFFTQIVRSVQPTDGAILTAEVTGDIKSELTKHHYAVMLRNVVGETSSLEYEMYVGPLRYTQMVKFDETAFKMVDLGWSLFRWFSEPLAKYVFIQYFDRIAPWFGNFGVAIVLMSVLIKLILWPLTKKSFESMAAMRALQPELQALQEKYGNDPQKQQEQLMKLYKTAGVNPLGGCLPNLLQMPILVTLWAYFQSAIEIRQESFLWVSDLSAPDFIINLPFEIPFLGSGIGGFCILMTASMIVQMRVSGQSGPANPQMQIMQWMMPAFLFFIFNSFSAGLNLYYFSYNVLSIGHQYLINTKNIDHTKLMATVEGGKKTPYPQKKSKKN